MSRVLPAIVVAVGVLSTLAAVRFVGGFSYYVGDDLLAFWFSVSNPIRSYLLLPNNMHVVPLLRLFALGTHALAPMNFVAGLAVLVGFHALAVAYLYRILQLFRRSTANLFVVVLYGTHIYFLVGLLWWGSGMLRFPYIALSLVAVFHYLRYRQTHSLAQAAIVLVAFLGALGFYSKALLIPVYLVGLEICLRGGTPWRRALQNLRPAVVAFACGVAYFFAWRASLGPSSGLNTSLEAHLSFQAWSWAILGFSTIGLPYEHATVNGFTWALVLGVWSGLVGFTVWRCRTNLAVWAVAAGCIALNFAAVGMSSRVQVWGHVAAMGYRYYFELVFLLAVFGGLAWHRALESPMQIALPRRLGAVGAAAVGLLLAAHAYTSHLRITELVSAHAHYNSHNQARRFMATLSGQLDEVERRGVPIAVTDGLAPASLGDRIRHSVLVRLSRKDRLILFARAGSRGQYRIDDRGRIVEEDW